MNETSHIFRCISVLEGPGCSSIGYGAASELGPLSVDINGTALLFNKYAWNQGPILSL